MKTPGPMLALLLGLLLPSLAAAQEAGGTKASVEKLAADEKVRAAFDEVIADLNHPKPGTIGATRFHAATERLVALGPAAAPFLVDELRAANATTFNIMSYVLGLTKGPGAVEALRNAIEAAAREPGQYSAARKQWAAYGLALAGDPDVVDILVDGGDTHVAWIEFMDGIHLVEVAAILTAPGSVPKLLAQLERSTAAEDPMPRAVFAAMALGSAGDPTAAPRVAALLGHKRWELRLAAARALGGLADPSVVDKLLAALDDPKVEVREAAGQSIEALASKEHFGAIVARLEVETVANVRASLYGALARTGDEKVVETYRKHWGRPEYMDRLGIADALGRLGSRKGLNLTREAVRDKDVGVAIRAMSALRRIGGAGATESFLALLNDPRWAIQETVIEILGEIREPRAGPRIAELLLRHELGTPILDASLKTHIEKMGDALVDLRYTQALDDLRGAIAGQSEPQIVQALRDLVKRLEILAENRDDVPKWIEAAESTDETVRRLAYGRLAELGGPDAPRALLASFDRASPSEKIEILRELGRARTPEASGLVERLLLDPAFDAADELPLRGMAAWVARQIGGEAMISALRRSAERREGRDMEVLVYLAVLTGKDAVPLIRSVRAPRLRYYAWQRGVELERLDWIVRELSAGGSIASLDAPPEAIALQ